MTKKSVLFPRMFIRQTVHRDGVAISEAKDLRSETAQIQALLRDGQYGRDDFFHNAGWYNKEGVFIGRGDLRTDQFIALPSVLPPDEIFFILGEGDALLDPPGIAYVIEKALALATPKALYVLPYYDDDRNFDAPQPCAIAGVIPGFKASRVWARRLVEAAT